MQEWGIGDLMLRRDTQSGPQIPARDGRPGAMPSRRPPVALMRCHAIEWKREHRDVRRDTCSPRIAAEP
jgi:hypothetical protein